MNRHSPEVLECALHLAHSAPVDSTLRVIARWRAGERGCPDALVPGARAQAQRRRRRHWPFAAAALLAAAAVWFSTLLGAGELARSRQAIGVLRPGAVEQRVATRFHAGDTLVAAAASELELADGTRIALGAHSLLTLQGHGGEVALEPRLGTIGIECPPRSRLRVPTPLGTVELTGPAAFAVRLTPHDYTTAFLQLAKEIHMQTRDVLLLTSFTLLTGTARVLDGPWAGDLAPGTTIQDPAPAADALDERLLAEAGDWTLKVTDFTPGSTETKTVVGTERCTVGPGREWLLCDLEIPRSGGTVAAHMVLGYDAMRRRWVGSFVDSFGGNMALLEGKPGDDPKCRVLTTRGFQGEREDAGRFSMKWIDDERRLTTFEVRDGDRWVKIREIEHHRRR